MRQLPSRRGAGPRRALRPGHIARPDDDPRRSRGAAAGARAGGSSNRLAPDAPGRRRRGPRPDARHLRRRDPGARGRRAHLLGLPHRSATAAPRTRCRSRSSSTWPASAGTRPATVEISVKLSDWMGTEHRRVRREHLPLRGRLQARSGAAPGRGEPGPRGPGHRRLQHHEGVRRRRRRPGARVLRGLDAGRRGDPREDGLGLAAQAHRERSRAARSRPWSSSGRGQALQLGGFRGDRGDADRPGPPLPRAGRLHRRRDRRDRRPCRPKPSPTPRPAAAAAAGRRPAPAVG